MILLAAGRGSRFGSEVPKVYLPCAGVPVLLRSARRLCQVADPRGGDAELIVVVGPADRATHLRPLEPELRALGCRAIVDGGDTRQQSMARGLAAADADTRLVLVHDAARPLFPVAAARQALAEAERVGAALLAVPATDTLKQVADDHLVTRTLDRRPVWYAQTPQVVRADLLRAALAAATAAGHDATDDVALVEWHGRGRVAVVPGSTQNLKVTRPEDLTLAQALLAQAADDQARDDHP